MVYRDRGSLLPEAMGTPASRAGAFDTIPTLIGKIYLVPDAANLRIDLRGELLGILNIAANTIRPGSL